MDTTIVAKDKIHFFDHPHVLSLVHLQQPSNKSEEDDDEDEEKDENEDNFVEEEHHGGKCNLCEEEIWSFHLCYYHCESCDFSLHTFCAELPRSFLNNPLHPDHDHELLYLGHFSHSFMCSICNNEFVNLGHYVCQVCYISIDTICLTMPKHKINHPSHPHQLERMSGQITSRCYACGSKHEGVFYQCTTCLGFRIYQDCALLPSKLLIQKHTDGTFTHSHPLTLAYSFPFFDQEAKFDPNCRVCSGWFRSHLWLYKCDRCRYYVHVDCATSKREPFSSIFLPASLGKTSKNFNEDEYPNLLHCPFHDESDNLVKRHMSNQNEFISKQHDSEVFSNFIHQHPLVLFDKQTFVGKFLHDPMKRVRLLCDGCVKPIMTVPFYMCCQYVDGKCCFVLHEWCAKLPSEVRLPAVHPEHTLFLMSKFPSELFVVFDCTICELPSNGFAYGCTICEIYVDINCAFIPEEITHDAHPDHLLSKVKLSANAFRFCEACDQWMHTSWVYHCPSCDFYIHVECALLLPRVIKHKCDKHPLSLRYEPAENHINEYFCEICETEFSPWGWFYHCTTCAQSMHASCVPLILQCEHSTYGFKISNYSTVYEFLNVKFGGALEIKGHSHHLTFVQGLEGDGKCIKCRNELSYRDWLTDSMIFKCLDCGFAFHYVCASSFIN